MFKVSVNYEIDAVVFADIDKTMTRLGMPSTIASVDNDIIKAHLSFQYTERFVSICMRLIERIVPVIGTISTLVPELKELGKEAKKSETTKAITGITLKE